MKSAIHKLFNTKQLVYMRNSINYVSIMHKLVLIIISINHSKYHS